MGWSQEKSFLIFARYELQLTWLSHESVSLILQTGLTLISFYYQ